MKYFKNLFLLLTGIYIIYFASHILIENIDGFSLINASISSSTLVVAFLTYLVSHALRVLRLVILSAEPSISIKNLWTAQLKANGVNLIVPFKMGEAYRLIAFKKFFGSYSKSFSILLCERFLDIALITLLLILSFYISNLEVELLTNLIFLSVFVLFLILFFYYSFDEFLVLINRIFVGKKSTLINLRIIKASSSLLNILKDTKSILSSKILSCLSITLLIWTFEIAVFYLLLGNLMLDGFIYIFLAASVALSSLLPNGPAGYGGIQLAFYLVGTSVGFEDLILYSFIYNLYIFGSAIAVAGLLFVLEFFKSIYKTTYAR